MMMAEEALHHCWVSLFVWVDSGQLLGNDTGSHGVWLHSSWLNHDSSWVFGSTTSTSTLQILGQCGGLGII